MNSQEHQKSSARLQIVFWSAGVILFFYFISLIKSILLPFVVGMLVAYFLSPLVRGLSLRKLSRSAAAGIITVTFFAVVLVLCIVLVPLIAHQLANLLHDFPNYIYDLQEKYGYAINDYISQLSDDQTNAIKGAIGNASGDLAGWAAKVFSGLLQSGLAFLDIISLIFITPIVAFYLLRDWDVLTARFGTLLPRKHADTITEQMNAIDRTLSGYIRGQTNVCLIMASYYGLMLTLVGLNFGLGIGIMTGFLLFIPFVGFATCFTLSVTVALFQFGFNTHLIAVVCVYLVGMFLESSVLTPRLVGNQVGLHPVWIIFGMLSGAALFGFVGVLISLPVTSVVGVLVKFAIERYMKSPLYLRA